jgi:hemerythrin
MARKGKNHTDRFHGRVGTCELCARDKPLTEHHLIPRAVHGKKYFQKHFTKEEMTHRRISIRRECHKGIHRTIPDEKELARNFNTKEALLADERIVKHLAWVAKQR